MPLFITWIVTTVTNLFVVLGKLFTQKVIISAAALAVYVALTATFILGLNTLFQEAITAAPSGTLFRAGLELIPSNAGQCIGLIGSAHLALWLYGFRRTLLKITLDAK